MPGLIWTLVALGLTILLCVTLLRRKMSQRTMGHVFHRIGASGNARMHAGDVYNDIHSSRKTFFHNRPREERYHLLIDAARKGHIDRLRLLIEAEADLDYQDRDGAMALHEAARNNRYDCVSLLLDNGADIDARDGKGLTAFMRAAAEQHIDIKRLLVQRGADPRILTPRRTLKGHTRGVLGVKFSPDGVTVASCSHDKTVRLWDVGSGTTLRVFNGHTDSVSSLAFSPSGTRMISGSWDKTIKMWDVLKGTEVYTFEGHISRVNAVAFAPNEKLIASGSDDKTIRLWDLANEVAEDVIRHTEAIKTIAFSLDGEVLAALSSNRTVMLWHVWRFAPKRIQGRLDNVNTVAVSSSCQLFACGSADGVVQVRALSFDLLRWLLPPRMNVCVTCCSPDGKIIIVRGAYGLLEYEERNSVKVRTFAGHSARVHDVDFSPVDELLISASEDKTVLLWEI